MKKEELKIYKDYLKSHYGEIWKCKKRFSYEEETLFQIAVRDMHASQKGQGLRIIHPYSKNNFMVAFCFKNDKGTISLKYYDTHGFVGHINSNEFELLATEDDYLELGDLVFNLSWFEN